jgi:hypothetical protein
MKMSNLLFATVLSLSIACAQEHRQANVAVLNTPGLITFWNFQEDGKNDLTALGPFPYTLDEMNGPIERTEDGIFGPASLLIERGQWLRVQRADCPALDISGRSQVTVIAWIKRKAGVHWQYIAGMWKEGSKAFKGQSGGTGPGAPARQYALFTSGHKQANYVTMERTDADHQPHGYVSNTGGATPGKPFCFSYATGKTTLKEDKWYMIAFTYDHEYIRVYTNGLLDSNDNYNPFRWNKPIFEAGEAGGDFTIAQRQVPSWPDYPQGMPVNKVGFGGILAGLAVFRRALDEHEIKMIYEKTRDIN